MTYGERLKTLRKEKNLTQQQVADYAGIKRRTYITYEQDNIRPRKQETYTKLAEILECDVNYLLIEDDVEKNVNVEPLLTAFLTVLGAGFLGGKSLLPGTAAITLFPALATVLGSSYAKKKTQGRNGLGEDDGLTYNNDQLLAYEKRQKQFRMTCMGLIYSELSSQGITCRTGNYKELENNRTLPDMFIHLDDPNIKSWWFSFWAKDAGLDDKIIISEDDRAAVMVSRYTTVKYDPTRKYSIVVDDKKLFDALIKFKDNNSFKGNLTAVLVNMEDMIVENEVEIAEVEETKGTISLMDK